PWIGGVVVAAEGRALLLGRLLAALGLDLDPAASASRHGGRDHRDDGLVADLALHARLFGLRPLELGGDLFLLLRGVPIGDLLVAWALLLVVLARQATSGRVGQSRRPSRSAPLLRYTPSCE